jgi:glycosyltransferase involved in cell wall biosynthesis
LDLGALWQAAQFVRQNRIQLLHAHASALFFARMLAALPPFPKLIWHDHYGRYAFNDRSVALYKAATLGVGAVVAVNQPLQAWSRDTLGIPARRVSYIPNLVEVETDAVLQEPLPGTAGRRIVCVANMRPQKDHPNLLRAILQLTAEFPDLHLLLAGGESDPDYSAQVVQMIRDLGLSKHVTYLGARADIAAILRNSDIAVLPSQSEGLPLALLEYGMAGLPVVSTSVGQCPEVLNNGEAGLLVAPSSPDELAQALRLLLQRPEERVRLGTLLKERVQELYSAPGVIAQICQVYNSVLGTPLSNKPALAAAGTPGRVL